MKSENNINQMQASKELTNYESLLKVSTLDIKEHLSDLRFSRWIYLILVVLACTIDTWFTFYLCKVFLTGSTLRLVDYLGFLGIIVPTYPLIYFSKLHASTLRDIRYFTNELTNLSCKILPVSCLSASPPDETISKIYLKLIETDRNRALKKEEASVDIKSV